RGRRHRSRSAVGLQVVVSPGVGLTATGTRLFVLFLFVFLFLVLFVLVFFVGLVKDALLGGGDAGRQLGRLARTQQHFFFVAQAVFPQLEQALVEQEHSVLAPSLNRRVDSVGLVFTDQVSNGGSDHHHFKGRHQSLGL